MKRDLRLRIEGSFPERLLNRALLSGARINHIRRIGRRVIVLSTDERSAAILSSLCEKYFLNFRILRRWGIPALKDAARTRWTLLPALLLCGIICALVLSRIWLVDICFTGSRPELGNKAAILASFDDIQSHICFPPPLTTVHFPKRMISSKSVELLLRRIARGGDTPVQEVLDSYLVVRETTAPPSKEPLRSRIKR